MCVCERELGFDGSARIQAEHNLFKLYSIQPIDRCAARPSASHFYYWEDDAVYGPTESSPA